MSSAILGTALVVGAAAWPAPAAAPMVSKTSTPPQVAKLMAIGEGPGAPTDMFGFSVAVSGDTCVVGAFRDDTLSGVDAGSAYVFTRSASTWTQQAKLRAASDGAADDLFGYAVAVSGDTCVVSAYRGDTPAGTDSGAAYVFTRSGSTWTQQAKLVANDAGAYRYFGTSVALSGDTCVVGAQYDDSAAGADAGTAYVFVRSGGTWAQQQKLTAPDGAASDWFGSSVAVSGDTCVVGAVSDDTSAGAGAGSAYVFARSGGVWAPQGPKLAASDAAASDAFGFSASMSSDTVVLGTPGTASEAGSAYVFCRSGSTWTQQQKLIASDGSPGNDFGYAVSVAGDTCVVGALSDDTAAGADAGSAYFFTRSGSTWTQQARVTASDGAASDNFGCSAALSGENCVVGAFMDENQLGAAAGAAYVFRADYTAPTTTLNVSPAAPNPVSGRYRSARIAMSANEPATTYFRWDSAAYAGYVSTITAPVGRHTLSYFSVDSAGNTETARRRTFAVLPRAVLSRPSTPARVAHGRYFTVSGTITPRVSGRTRLTFFRKAGRRWWKVKSVWVTNRRASASRSRYATRVVLARSGSWHVSAYFAGGATANANTSAKRYFTAF